MTILQKLAAPITSAFAAVTGGDMLDTAEYRRAADAKFRPPAFAPKSRTWTDEPPDGQKRLPAPLPVPRLTPDAPPDLAEAEGQLVFLVEQRNTIQAELNRFPRSSTTPIPDALARQRQYADRFGSRVDLANEPAADLSLALLVLRNPEGLISAARARVYQIQTEIAERARHVRVSAALPKARRDLAEALMKFKAAYEAALPAFQLPQRPHLSPTVSDDVLLSLYKKIKHAKKPDDLLNGHSIFSIGK